MLAGFYWGEVSQLDKVSKVWKSAGINAVSMGNVATKSLLLAPKILIPSNLTVSKDGFQAAVIGIFIYKGLAFEAGLTAALRDILHQKFDELAVRGTFALLVFNENQLKIWLDATIIQHLYLDKHAQNLSTSFLAIAETKASKAPNLKSFQEILLTGTQIGPETLLEGIEKVEPNSIPEIPGVQIRICQRPNEGLAFRTREEALEDAQARIEACFQDYQPLAKHHGALLGLTGGLDSRLNLALALKQWPSPIEVYTNCRIRKGKERVIDEPLALKAAEAVGLKLRAGWMVHPLDMEDRQLNQVMEQSFQFFDGHGRMHAQWFEDYNTARFKKELMGDRLFGLSGIGGEQYRNFEGLLLGSWSKDYFVRYHLTTNYCGPAFTSKKEEDKFVDFLGAKVWAKIKPEKRQRISHQEVKKYLNEILIANRLGARNNAENRLAWFASPFTDPSVSIPAYSLSKWLGSSIAFEKDLITRLNAKLSEVPLDYGIRPNEELTFSMQLKPWLRRFIPPKIWVNNRIGPISTPGRYALFNELHRQSPLIQDCVNEVKSLALPIQIDRLCALPDFMPVVVNMGYFLLKLKQNSFTQELSYE